MRLDCNLCMGWRRLPTLLAHVPLRTLPLSEQAQKTLDQTGHVSELAFKTVPRIGKVLHLTCPWSKHLLDTLQVIDSIRAFRAVPDLRQHLHVELAAAAAVLAEAQLTCDQPSAGLTLPCRCSSRSGTSYRASTA